MVTVLHSSNCELGLMPRSSAVNYRRNTPESCMLLSQFLKYNVSSEFTIVHFREKKHFRLFRKGVLFCNDPEFFMRARRQLIWLRPWNREQDAIVRKVNWLYVPAEFTRFPLRSIKSLKINFLQSTKDVNLSICYYLKKINPPPLINTAVETRI